MEPFIDAHIHLEQYSDEEVGEMVAQADGLFLKGLIAVSMDLLSSRRTKALSYQAPRLIHPAYGFHPEQSLPSMEEMEGLFRWMAEEAKGMAAIGEVGLPYYRRREAEERGIPFDSAPYIMLLERFIKLAKSLRKPIVLHAVYEDAETACDMLEEHEISKAHFHWFKGAERTLMRLIKNGYFISITPDVLYEKEIQDLVKGYPLHLMMVETDGPWPFEGPFRGERTHPRMIRRSIEKIAEIKGLAADEVARRLFENTKAFYEIA